MFIDNNINHQSIYEKANLLDKNINLKKNSESDDFIKNIKTALEELSSIQNNAKIDSEKFVLDESEKSLQDVMINQEKSFISMSMAIQIRNKIVSAYQEIMSQQV